MKTIILPLKDSMNPSPVRLAFLVTLFVLACFPLSPQALATCQENCLTNYNTSLGEDALLNNTGSWNTAVGFDALFNNTTGNFNTANGEFTLYNNTVGSWNTAIGAFTVFF